MYSNNIRNINKLKYLLSKVEKIDHYTYLSIEKELIYTNPNLEKHLNDEEMFNVKPTNSNFAPKWWHKRNFWSRQEDGIMNDKQFISFNIKSHALLMLYANKDLRLNRTFVLSLIRDNPDVIHHIDDSLRNISFYWSAFKANKKSARWLMQSPTANLIAFVVCAILYLCMLVSFFKVFILDS